MEPRNTFGARPDMPPQTEQEPTRKGVAGTLVGSLALVVLYVAEQMGLPMELEVALAIAGLLGAAAAWLKDERSAVSPPAEPEREDPENEVRFDNGPDNPDLPR